MAPQLIRARRWIRDVEALLRIVVVEDEALIALELEATLEQLGYQVCATAMDADQAVAAADRHRPDLVLMDIRLAHGSNGIDAAIAIRRRFDIPSLFLSANLDDAARTAAAPAQPLGFLSKPFNAVSLHSTLQQIRIRLSRP